MNPHDDTERRSLGLPNGAEDDIAFETRYRRVVECAPLGIHFYRLMNSGDLVFTGANPAADDVLGTDNGQFVGMRIEEAFPPLVGTEVPDRYRMVALDGGQWENQEIVYDDGSIVGAFDVLVFQTEPNAIAVMFSDITEQQRTEEELRSHREELERLVDERTHELTVAHVELGGIIAVVSRTVEIRDPYTAGHQQRVAVLAGFLGERLGMDERELSRLVIAASIHDLGKISIPADILTKPSTLSEPEYAIIQEHPAVAHEILSQANFDWPLAQIILEHHERMDGSGYPQGLVGENTHLWARILAVADVVEAMSSHRPYRPALGVDAALEEIAENRATLYCPECVDACLDAFTAGFAFE